MGAPARSPITRSLWVALGLVAVAVAGIGVVLPGLPTTGPLIFAAWCFSRSSPRLEQWILGLPKFGPLIRSYRAGLGMGRTTKWWAITVLALAVSLSVWRIGVASPVSWVVAATGLIGALWILFRVPTTETVLRQRAADNSDSSANPDNSDCPRPQSW